MKRGERKERGKRRQLERSGGRGGSSSRMMGRLSSTTRGALHGRTKNVSRIILCGQSTSSTGSAAQNHICWQGQAHSQGGARTNQHASLSVPFLIVRLSENRHAVFCKEGRSGPSVHQVHCWKSLIGSHIWPIMQRLKRFSSRAALKAVQSGSEIMQVAEIMASNTFMQVAEIMA